MKWLSDRPLWGGLIAGIAAVVLACLLNFVCAGWYAPDTIGWRETLGLIVAMVPIGWFYMGMFFRQQKRLRDGQ